MYEITLKQIKTAIKARHNRNCHKPLDEHIVNCCKSDKSAANFGPLTSEIASYLEKDQAKTRYWLNKFCKSGYIHKQSTKGGSCRWWYEGLINELKEERGIN